MSSRSDLMTRIRRSPDRIRSSYSWTTIYDAYWQLTGKYPTENQKTRWRRMGKLYALNELEAIGRPKGYDSIMAWSSTDAGMKDSGQKTL